MWFQHPKNVCMTYFQHFRFAMEISFLFLSGSVVSLVHAFIPDVFTKTPTFINEKIKYEIENSGCRKESE